MSHGAWDDRRLAKEREALEKWVEAVEQDER